MDIVASNDSGNAAVDRSTRQPLTHRVIARVAQILEMTARDSGGLSLTEIARQLSAPVSSVQSLVNGLVATGYLSRAGTKYFLGPAPYVLNLIAQRPPIRVVTHDDLEALHQQTGQMALLGVVLDGKVIYIDHVTTDARFGFVAETHAPRPLLRTAIGRVLLASLDQRHMFELLRSVDGRDASLVEPFLLELPAIQASELAITRGLVSPGYWTIATPVREQGRLVAAVGLSGAPRVMRERMDEFGALLLERTRQWSGRITKEPLEANGDPS
jgi:DNA-binding IclR family transcriptional regulator